MDEHRQQGRWNLHFAATTNHLLCPLSGMWCVRSPHFFFPQNLPWPEPSGSEYSTSLMTHSSGLHFGWQGCAKRPPSPSPGAGPWQTACWALGEQNEAPSVRDRGMQWSQGGWQEAESKAWLLPSRQGSCFHRQGPREMKYISYTCLLSLEVQVVQSPFQMQASDAN